jgi:hypothetical protein
VRATSWERFSRHAAAIRSPALDARNPVVFRTGLIELGALQGLHSPAENRFPLFHKML